MPRVAWGPDGDEPCSGEATQSALSVLDAGAILHSCSMLLLVVALHECERCLGSRTAVVGWSIVPRERLVGSRETSGK